MRAIIFSVLSLSLLCSSALAKEYTSFDGVKVEINNPKKILVLNTSNLEIFYELKKQDMVVGTDTSAEFPPEVKKLPSVGHPYRPSVEGMISLKPDLIVAAADTLPPESTAQLRSAKIPVLVFEDTGFTGVEGLKMRIRVISEVVGAVDSGKSLITKLEKSFAEVEKAKGKAKKSQKVFFLYAHGPGTAFIYGRDTGASILLELVGAKNAADFTTGMKPLTAEAMVQASPDIIIMLNRGIDAVGGIEGALKLPGVMLTPAGKNKRIIAVDNSIRWVGPRFPEFAKKLLAEINP